MDSSDGYPRRRRVPPQPHPPILPPLIHLGCGCSLTRTTKGASQRLSKANSYQPGTARGGSVPGHLRCSTPASWPRSAGNRTRARWDARQARPGAVETSFSAARASGLAKMAAQARPRWKLGAVGFTGRKNSRVTPRLSLPTSDFSFRDDRRGAGRASCLNPFASSYGGCSFVQVSAVSR